MPLPYGVPCYQRVVKPRNSYWRNAYVPRPLGIPRFQCKYTVEDKFTAVGVYDAGVFEVHQEISALGIQTGNF